ncbi:MAG: hypothetical protein Q8M24_26025 [Pseudolabrys sp.]|nr:hypothetical protein [Pseudolabrys sp.]
MNRLFDLSGRSIVITGATGALGKAAALALAAMARNSRLRPAPLPTSTRAQIRSDG